MHGILNSCISDITNLNLSFLPSNTRSSTMAKSTDSMSLYFYTVKNHTFESLWTIAHRARVDPSRRSEFVTLVKVQFFLLIWLYYCPDVRHNTQLYTILYLLLLLRTDYWIQMAFLASLKLCFALIEMHFLQQRSLSKSFLDCLNWMLCLPSCQLF